MFVRKISIYPKKPDIRSYSIYSFLFYYLSIEKVSSRDKFKKVDISAHASIGAKKSACKCLKSGYKNGLGKNVDRITENKSHTILCAFEFPNAVHGLYGYCKSEAHVISTKTHKKSLSAYVF
jgi:hypothetical protein